MFIFEENTRPRPAFHTFRNDGVTHKKEVVKLIQSISGKYSPHQILSDFVTVFAISIQNSCVLHRDKVWHERERLYNDTINRYDEDEKKVFYKMAAHLSLAFECEIGDILGEIYMESGAGNKNTGQFFTPFNLSLATAELAIPENLSEGETFSMNEPSAGAGGMILAMAKVLNEKGFNYQQCMRVVAQDLDWTAAYMCYIQMSMYGINGIVVQGDTLMEPYHANYPRSRVFRTPKNCGCLM